MTIYCIYVYNHDNALYLPEYDKFLEEHKSELSQKMVEDDDPSMYQDQEYEIDQADQQVIHTLLCVTNVVGIIVHNLISGKSG